MIKQLAVSCLTPKPELNNLNQLLQMMLTDSVGKRTKTVKYLNKIFKYYQQSDLLNNSQVGAFLFTKMYAYAEIVCMRLLAVNQTQEEDNMYYQCLCELITIDYFYTRNQVITILIKQMAELQQKELLISVVQLFRRMDIIVQILTQLNDTDYNTIKVDFILGLPALQLMTKTNGLCQKTNKKRKRDSAQLELMQDEVFKQQYQKLLMSVLKDQRLQTQTVNQIIKNLCDNILNKLPNPIVLSEFVLHVFQHHQSLQLRTNALAALFILVGKYGLEMNNFYDKLLTLVCAKNSNNTSVFELPTCKRIYKLIQNCLRSSKVPFKVVSTFVQRLLELVFIHNAAYCCWAVALVFNIIKKHRNLLKCLKQGDQQIYFHQLHLLKHHYLPEVRQMVEQLHKNLDKLDFLEIESFAAVKPNKIFQNKLQDLSKLDIVFELPDQMPLLI